MKNDLNNMNKYKLNRMNPKELELYSIRPEDYLKEQELFNPIPTQPSSTQYSEPKWTVNTK